MSNDLGVNEVPIAPHGTCRRLQGDLVDQMVSSCGVAALLCGMRTEATGVSFKDWLSLA